MNLPKNITLFFFLGIPSILAGIIYAIILITGNSAQDGLLGIYILFGLIPVSLVILIDRLLVRKFGNQKVNKVQFSFLLFIILLWIVRAIANLFV
jgi:phosphatidylserine synthase